MVFRFTDTPLLLLVVARSGPTRGTVVAGILARAGSHPAIDPERRRRTTMSDLHDPSEPGMMNIRNLSIKCGNCDTYQTLSAYSRREDWNVYTYECENDVCDPEVTRTYVEVPQDLDAFARRDPGWRGGKVHAGG